MDVLVACEVTQEITAAFRERGHNAFSCDLKPAAREPKWHIQGDARDQLTKGWDLLIAHPPCTRLANSGVRWLMRRRLWKELEAAADLFLAFWNAPIEKIGVENPVMHGYAIDLIGRYPDQLVQPHYFGEPYFKGTCLWLKGLPLLKPTNKLTPPEKGTPEHAAWSACHRAPDSKGQADRRAETLPGVAAAIADQWGKTAGGICVPLPLTATPQMVAA